MTGLFRVLRGRAGVRAVLKNIGWLGGDRIVRMLGGIIVMTAVARYLGPSQLGLLNYALAIYNLFNIVSNLGLDFLLVRELALDESLEPELLGTGFVLKAVASVGTTVAAVAAARLLDPTNRMLIWMVAMLSVAAISQAFDVIEYFFQSRTQSRYSVMPRTLTLIAASVARFAAVWLHLSLIWFAVIAAAEIALAEVGLVISYLSARKPLVRWAWQTGRARALLKESWPLTVANLMAIVYMRCDQVLLGKLASTTAVGEYSAAVRLSEIWYAIPTIVCLSVMPKLLRDKAQNQGLYYARLQRLYESMVLISVLVAVGTQFAGPFAVRLFFGREFASAAPILAVHIWTGVFVFVGAVSSQQFIQEGLIPSLMRRSILGAVLNVGLNLWWIPRWGGIGSAMATLVAQGFSCYFADGMEAGTRHVFRMKTHACLTFWMLPWRLREHVSQAG